jgi:hypothetical protein
MGDSTYGMIALVIMSGVVCLTVWLVMRKV